MLPHVETQRAVPEFHHRRSQRSTQDRAHPATVDLAKGAINDGGGMGYGLQKQVRHPSDFRPRLRTLFLRQAQATGPRPGRRLEPLMCFMIFSRNLLTDQGEPQDPSLARNDAIGSQPGVNSRLWAVDCRWERACSRLRMCLPRASSLPQNSTPRKQHSMPLCRRGFTPRAWTHEGNALFESGHKAPPTAEFLPVTGKTRFAAEAALSRLQAGVLRW